MLRGRRKYLTAAVVTAALAALALALVSNGAGSNDDPGDGPKPAA